MADSAERMFTTRGGRTLRFGALGLGTAPLGNMHRVLSEDEAAATLTEAWSLGLRYFDTAPLYGHGLSETRLGRALAGRHRDDYLVSTKVGRLLEPCAPGEEESGIYKDTPHLRVRFDYSYDGVMRSHEASLRRLGLDCVDILFVHDVDARSHGGAEQSEARIRELVDGGGWRALSELRASGAVSAIGAGVNEWQPCARLLALADPDLFLLAGRYTLLEQDALHGLLSLCAARGVGIVIGGAFNSGILAGRATYDYETATADIVARVRALNEVCKRHDVPLAQAALQFPLAHPAVAALVVGAQTPREIAENAARLGRPTPPGLWAALKAEGLIDTEAPTPSQETVRTC